MMEERHDEMQTPGRNRRQHEAPLYIRWNPERTPYTIELKLNLAKRLAEDVRQAMRSGQEAGGVLMGTLPDAVTPTLRIDDVQMIPRRPEDGMVFLLSPREHDRLVSLKWEAARSGRVPVGFMRTHGRSGPLRPSLADRTLLAGEFDTSAYVLLLIEANERRTAAFFVGAKGDLADEPSVSEFRFEEAELTGLPEFGSERIVDSIAEAAPNRSGTMALAVALIGFLLAGLYVWAGVPPEALRTPEQGLRLAVSGGDMLRVSWNRRASDLERATGGKLVITAGNRKSEVPLSVDELRFGAVSMERPSTSGEVTLVLSLPGDAILTQSAGYSPLR